MILYSIPSSNAFYDIYNKLIYHGLRPEHWIYCGIQYIGGTSFEVWDIGESVSYVVEYANYYLNSYKVVEIGPGAKCDNSQENDFDTYDEAFAEAKRRNKKEQK